MLYGSDRVVVASPSLAELEATPEVGPVVARGPFEEILAAIARGKSEGGTVATLALVVRFFQRQGLGPAVAVSSGVINTLGAIVCQTILVVIGLVLYAASARDPQAPADVFYAGKAFLSANVARWVAEGKIKAIVDIVDGLDKAPQAVRVVRDALQPETAARPVALREDVSENPVVLIGRTTVERLDDMRSGVTFIGPSADAMRKLGDKVGSKLIAEEVGVPVAAPRWRAHSDEDSISICDRSREFG